MTKKAKKKTTRRRYSAAKKKLILETAAKEKLTGIQVQKRFGIPMLTFYRWRGPKRRKATGKSAKIPALAKGVTAKARQQVQAEVRRTMPKIIQEEIAAYLKTAFA